MADEVQLDHYKAYIADISEFKPDPKNHNKHRLKGHKMVTNSMQNRGYARPGFAANDGTVLGGNLSTMEIAPSLGIGEGKVLVVETDGDIPIIHKRRDVAPDSLEARQLSYEDNFTSHFSFELDPEIVSLDLSNGFNFDAIGVSLEELGEMLEGGVEELLRGDGQETKDAPAQIDKAKELQAKWGTELGQVWELGEHRIVIGDCTDPAVVEAVMRGERAQAVVTDSPYGMNVDGVANDNEEGLSLLFDRVLVVLPVRDSIVVNFQGARLFWKWLDAVRKYGHKIERALWMYKPNDGTYPWRGWLQTGQVIVISSTGNPTWGEGEYKHDTYVENFVGNELEKLHATPKPLPVISHLISWVSPSGSVVLDPFLGSGTTLIACENLGRKCRGIELSPAYAAVTIQRFVDLGNSLTPIRVSG